MNAPISFSVLPAFLLARFSAWAGKQALYPQAAQTLLERPSCDQRRVGNTTAARSRDEAVKPVNRVRFDVAVIQPERELINIAPKMFLGNVMINTIDAALENRPYAFNAIGSNATTHKFLFAMVDCGVDIAHFKSLIAAVLIRMNGRSGLYVFTNDSLQSLRIGSLNRHSNRTATTLTHTDDCGLSDCTATGVELFIGVLVLFLAANVCLVYFNNTMQYRRIIAARLTDALQKEPCRFLRDANLFGKLHGRNALARSDQQIHRIQPFVQRNMRALEYRTSANGEILLALIAAIIAAFARRDAVCQATNWAARTVGPEPRFQIGPRAFLIRKHLEKLESADSQLVVHGLLLVYGLTVRHKSEGVKYIIPKKMG